MLKGKKSSRPEITIVGARPMNDSPFIVDSFSRNLQSPTEPHTEAYSIPSNGFDCIITRTSTLPATRTRDKKQRPKSEIYNGFTSLRTTRTAKADQGTIQKENKRVTRSKSLHAPKKPPRDFSTRPTSISPCGKVDDTKLSVGPMTSLTPTRPAPPVPLMSFNKKNQRSISPTKNAMDVSSQREEDRVRAKRIRSKSTSTANDKEKPRGPATLPRGRSFNTHGARPMIKATQDEDVVILTRTNSVDESHERDIKLKSFGVKVSRSPDNILLKSNAIDSNDTKGLATSNGVTCVASTAQCATESDNNNAKCTVNGHVSLSDAIQSNAVYTRLQHKNENQIDASQDGESMSENHAENSPKNCTTLSDAINSSSVLAKLRQKNQSDENCSEQFESKKGKTIRGADKDAELVEGKERKKKLMAKNDDNERERIVVGETDNDREKDASQEIIDTLEESRQTSQSSREKQSSDDNVFQLAQPIASYVVKTIADTSPSKVAKIANGNGRSMTLDGDFKKGSPPPVKPKPRIPKRPSMEKIVLRPLNDVENAEGCDETTSNEEAKSKSSPLVIESRISQQNLSKNVLESDDKDTSKADTEKEGQRKTFAEKMSGKGENDSLTILEGTENKLSQGQGLIDNELSSADKTNERDSTHNIKSTSRSNPSSRNTSASDQLNTVHFNAICKEQIAYDEDVFHDDSILPRKKSESEVESAGSVDSLTSLASQVTVIFNPEATKPAVNSTNRPAPFDTHQTKNRRKSTPEPYSSHPGRRPKPAKATTTNTLKSKNRKSKSLYGRRLNSSPPSTPPPPPKINYSESKPETEKNKNRPPVPPRAPSMYIQSESLDQCVPGSNNVSTTRAAPPRPSKPPALKHASNLENRNNFDVLKRLEKAYVDPVKDGGNTIEVNRDENTNECTKDMSNGYPMHFCASDSLAQVDFRQTSTNTGNNQSSKEFSKKLEYFKNSVEESKRAHTLSKQRSLDLNREKMHVDQEENALSFEQLRKEGEEALRIVSQLRKENGDISVGKKRSPVPQKPKRPSSVNMDNVVIFDTNNVNPTLIDSGVKNRKPPPKPERSPQTFKPDVFEVKTPIVEDTQVEKSKELSSGCLPHVELRSNDAGLHQNLKSVGEKKTVPKKPARTSSLKRNNASQVKVKCKKEPAVLAVREEGVVNCDGEGSRVNPKDEIDAGRKTESKVGNKFGDDMNRESVMTGLETKVAKEDESVFDDKTDNIEAGVDAKYNDENGDANKMKEIDSDLKSGLVANDCDDDTKDSQKALSKTENHDAKSERRKSKSSEVVAEERENGMSAALSTQIDQLDRIILETSSVLSERLSDSICSIDDSMEYAPPQLESSENNVFVKGDTDCSSQTDIRPETSAVTTEVKISRDSHTVMSNIGTDDTILNKIYQNSVKCAGKEMQENAYDKCSSNLGSVCNSQTNELQINLPANPKEASWQKIQLEVDDTKTSDSNAKLNVSSQLASSNESDKNIPPKPSRPMSFSKVVENDFHTSFKANTDSNQNVAKKLPETVQVPERPSDLTEPAPTDATKPLLRRAKSAPERPSLPTVTRKSRPPIPSILREKEANNDVGENRENGFMGNIRKIMEITEPHGIAVYDYNSNNERDLQFKAGEVIFLQEKVNSDWWLGTANGKKGIFPLNCIEVIIPLPSNDEDLNKDDEILMSEKPVALAIYSFVAGNENELTFDSGDTIELVSKKSEDWFVGRCNGNEGCFPASFVAVLKPLQSQPEPNSPKLADLEDNNKTALTSEVNVTSETSFTNEDGKNDSSNKITVADEVDLIQAVNQNVCGCFGIAIADFVGTVDGDLSFKNGQEIQIISSVNEDWFKGSLQDRTGIFPKSFVKIDNN